MNVPPDSSSSVASSNSSGPWAFLDGVLVPASEARLALFDAGLVQGATATDFVRTFHQKPYLLREHLERFGASCQLAEIPLQVSLEELERIATELASRNCRFLPTGQELALILLATPGAVEFYAGDVPHSAGPTLAMHTAPLRLERFARYWREGIHLATPQVRSMPAECLSPHIKQRSRLHWRLAQAQIDREHPGAIALLLDRDGFVTETAAANFLIVKQNTILSPPLDTVLPGISLGVVRQICVQLGLAFREERISLDDCTQVQEAFLTNTSFCLAGISRINQLAVPWPGPIGQRILSVWNEKVGLDIVEQIRQSR
jgi:branched-chain amino acid aminotransferase